MSINRRRVMVIELVQMILVYRQDHIPTTLFPGMPGYHAVDDVCGTRSDAVRVAGRSGDDSRRSELLYS